MTKIKSNKQYSPAWILASLGAYGAGIGLSFFLSDQLLSKGTTPDLLINLLTLLAVTGLAFGGVGQLCRAVAHNSPGLNMLDGLGKVIGLFGWSVGIMSAFLFAYNNTDAPGWFLGFAIFLILVAPTVIFVYLAIRWIQPKRA